MSTQLARQDNSALAPAPATSGMVPIRMGPAEIEVFRNTYCKEFNQAEVSFAVQVCVRTNLDPFKKEIYFWRGEGGKIVSHVGVDGWVKKASETGRYLGIEGPYYIGEDGQKREVWTDKKNLPVACMVRVYWRGCPAPVTGIAYYSEFMRKGRDGGPNAMWRDMPLNQLYKCAFVQALRKCPNNEIAMAVEDVDADFRVVAEETPGAPALQTGTPIVEEVPPAAPATAPTPPPPTPVANPSQAFQEAWVARGFDAHDTGGMKDYVKRALGRSPRNAKQDPEGYKSDLCAVLADFETQPEVQAQAEAHFLGDDDALRAAVAKACGTNPPSIILTTTRELRAAVAAVQTSSENPSADDDDFELQQP